MRVLRIKITYSVACHWCLLSQTLWTTRRPWGGCLFVFSKIQTGQQRTLTFIKSWLQIQGFLLFVVVLPGATLKKPHERDLGRFPFSQKFRKFRSGGKWKTLFRFAPLKNYGNELEHLKRLSRLTGWKFRNGITCSICTFPVYLTSSRPITTSFFRRAT